MKEYPDLTKKWLDEEIEETERKIRELIKRYPGLAEVRRERLEELGTPLKKIMKQYPDLTKKWLDEEIEETERKIRELIKRYPGLAEVRRERLEKLGTPLKRRKLNEKL
jgi:uncharacterized protein involved in exopolysaccharide biosynthesis